MYLDGYEESSIYARTFSRPFDTFEHFCLKMSRKFYVRSQGCISCLPYSIDKLHSQLGAVQQACGYNSLWFKIAMRSHVQRRSYCQQEMINLGVLKGKCLPFIWTVHSYGIIEVTHSGGMIKKGKSQSRWFLLCIHAYHWLRLTVTRFVSSFTMMRYA